LPTYPYECLQCKHEFEVIKQVRFLDEPEACPHCSGDAQRFISKHQQFYGAGDWNKLEFNHGLGQWVEGGSKARDRIAKERGLTEVGNEDPEKIAKYQDDKLNTILEDNWSKV
jgi:putative FmdB family regulatory protein